MTDPRWLERLGSPNLTDLYQLTMLQAYRHIGMDDIAVFEFFVRKLPDHRNFMLAAGLQQLLDYLVDFRFQERDLEALRRTEKLDDAFIDSLAQMRFTGDVDAMPEGTAFFGNEPIARVVAPLPEAQLIETRVVNLLQMQTLIASKAARMRLAAHDHQRLVDFGLRRAHGSEAGLFAARAAWIGGFDGTATVLAHELYGIPIFGTMAHSFIQAHDSEMRAFEDFCRSQPENTVLLIDTYDTEEGARKVVELARKLGPEGFVIRGVRIDSGDLYASAKAVRRIRRGRLRGHRDHGQRRAERGPHRRPCRRRHTGDGLRCGHGSGRLRRRALPRLRLQDPGIRRHPAAQEILRQGHLAGPQAGVPPPPRQRHLRPRRHRPGGRSAGRRTSAPAGHARRRTAGRAGGARRHPRTGGGPDGRPAQGSLAAARGSRALPGGDLGRAARHGGAGGRASRAQGLTPERPPGFCRKFTAAPQVLHAADGGGRPCPAPRSRKYSHNQYSGNSRPVPARQLQPPA